MSRKMRDVTENHVTENQSTSRKIRGCHGKSEDVTDNRVTENHVTSRKTISTSRIIPMRCASTSDEPSRCEALKLWSVHFMTQLQGCSIAHRCKAGSRIDSYVGLHEDNASRPGRCTAIEKTARNKGAGSTPPNIMMASDWECAARTYARYTQTTHEKDGCGRASSTTDNSATRRSIAYPAACHAECQNTHCQVC